MNNLSEQAREERNAYVRQWRSKNRDKVAATNKRYWEKRAALKKEAENNGKPKE